MRPTTLRLVAWTAVALVASTSLAHAGPCLDEIAQVQQRMDSTVEQIAAAGRTARQGTGLIDRRLRLLELPLDALAVAPQTIVGDFVALLPEPFSRSIVIAIALGRNAAFDLGTEVGGKRDNF